ncbi:MAG TPA: bacillithiol biosynthesis BshC [Candidatus Krumholzibacteria bacterium]|nr:bacillithiol biosynthesis BshC [Candidatus Krumholzibacteria bacterium]
MTVLARVDAATIDGVSALYRDFIARPGSAVQKRLPVFTARDAWTAAVKRPARVDGALVDAVRGYNQTLGVDAPVLARLDGLADGSVRAVVTGQQPGVLGGPLLSLYKAATAIALARHVEKSHGQPCVAVFWLGADDDDFAEVRELSVLGTDHTRLDIAIDGSAYRPGLRVGDMNAASVRAVWNAVQASLPAGRAHDHLAASVAAAGDFADSAARVLVAATRGQMLIVDARTPQLRLAARDLLLAFFDRENELRALLEADSRALEADGYHTQVQWGADAGLFVVENGIRLRVPPEKRAEVRAQIERDITRVSPGVIARNALQDAVLAPVAVVLGPAEIAYRAQMTGIYRALGVSMPVVAPRLSATYLPPAVRDMIAALGLDASEIVADPAALAARASASGGNDGMNAAAAAFEAAFAKETAAFFSVSGGRLDDRARHKLEKRMDEISGRLAQALASAIEQDTSGPRSRWPFLPRMADMFRKDAAPQERFLSMVMPMLDHGDDAWRAIDAMAAEWAVAALDGRVWHTVY